MPVPPIRPAPPRRLLVGVLATTIVLAGCAGGGSRSTEPSADDTAASRSPSATSRTSTPATPSVEADASQPIAVLTDDEAAALARDVNAFGFDLHEGLVAAHGGGNVVTSPLSASVLLAMLAAGAQGETGQQFVDVLGLEDTHDTRYAALLRQVVDTDDVEVSLANALWAGVPLRDDYRALARQTFDATIESAPLGDQSTADAIDDWVRDQTNDRIDGIAKELGLPNAAATVVLANAVYFLGEWTTAFDPEDTTDEPFTLPGGEAVDVPMMHASPETPLEASLEGDMAVVRLPYGDEGRFALEVFLPPPDQDLGAFLDGFDAQQWADATAALRPTTDLALSLPRFELTGTSPLDDVLQELGLADAFGSGADFGAMGPVGWLDTVVQKTFIRVDEAGTEAAAVTGGAMETSIPPSVIVDRPFAFTISDQQTGAILFLGTVTDPRG